MSSAMGHAPCERCAALPKPTGVCFPGDPASPSTSRFRGARPCLHVRCCLSVLSGPSRAPFSESIASHRVVSCPVPVGDVLPGSSLPASCCSLNPPSKGFVFYTRPPRRRGQVPVSLQISLSRPRSPPRQDGLPFLVRGSAGHGQAAWPPGRPLLRVATLLPSPFLLDAFEVRLWGRCPSESLEEGQAVTSSSRCVRSRPVMVNL